MYEPNLEITNCLTDFYSVKNDNIDKYNLHNGATYLFSKKMTTWINECLLCLNTDKVKTGLTGLDQ